MQRKLTATLVAKLTVPDGKKSIKIFDTEVAGLGVRKMATGIASFIFEKRPKGAVAAKQQGCASSERTSPFQWSHYLEGCF